jgi:hypothetical protein
MIRTAKVHVWLPDKTSCVINTGDWHPHLIW